MVAYLPNPFKAARNVSITYPKAPASFLIKAVKTALNATATEPLAKQKNTRQGTIQSLVEEHCLALKKNYNPSWWLPNGHAQTMYCVAGDFSQVDHISYTRYRILLMKRQRGYLPK